MLKELWREEVTMDIKTKFMFRTLLGFTLGLIIGIIMFALSIPDGAPFDRTFFIFHLIGSSIMGLVGYGGAIVYDIESWSLGRATFTHYIVTFMTMFVISEMLGWFSHDVLFYTFLAFTFAYAMIWLFEYLVWKKQIRQMNDELEVMLKKNNQ